MNVSYKTALLAKEKGFDEDCTEGFSPEKELRDFHYHWWQFTASNSEIFTRNTRTKETRAKLYPEEIFEPDFVCTAPTQSVLQKWLREKQGRKFHFQIYPCSGVKNLWDCNIYVTDNNFKTTGAACSISCKKSYEDALELALFNALKLIPCK